VTPPGGVTPNLKLIFFVAEFRKNTGQTKWEDGNGEATTATQWNVQLVHHFLP